MEIVPGCDNLHIDKTCQELTATLLACCPSINSYEYIVLKGSIPRGAVQSGVSESILSRSISVFHIFVKIPVFASRQSNGPRPGE